MSVSEKSESSIKAQRLQPGDLILIKTPSAVYSTFRTLADHQYDHIAVVLDDKMSLHITFPKAKQVPTFLFTHKRKNPLIIRPHLSDGERQQFMESLKRESQGKPYDFFRVLQLIISKQLYQLQKFDDQSRDKIVCSHLVYQCLAQTLKPVDKHLKASSDYDLHKYGTFTISDFVKLALSMPSYFEIFELYNQEETAQNEYEGITLGANQDSSIISKVLGMSGMQAITNMISDYNALRSSQPFTLPILSKQKELKERIIMFLTIFNLAIVLQSAYSEYKELNNVEKKTDSRYKIVKELIIQLSQLLLIIVDTKVSLSTRMLKPLTKILILASPGNSWKIQTMKAMTLLSGIKNKLSEKFKL